MQGLKRGRPISNIAEKLDQRTIDATISLWKGKEELSFVEIHNGLVKKGIVRNEKDHYKTDRILDKLIRIGFIEKLGRGRYKLNVLEDEFDLFDYLNRLRSKEDGGVIKMEFFYSSILSKVFYIGMPKDVIGSEEFRIVEDILGSRLTGIFNAYRQLISEIKSQKMGEKKEGLTLPSSVLRELYFDLIPFLLSQWCKASYRSHEIAPVIREIIEKVLSSYFPTGSCFPTWENEYERLNSIQETVDYGEAFSTDFALIVTGSESDIDKDNVQKRCVLSTLKEASSRKRSSLSIAKQIYSFEERNIKDILDKLGWKFFDKKKVEEIYHYCVRLHIVAELIATLHELREISRLGQRVRGDKKEWVYSQIKELRTAPKDYDINEIIRLLPLSGDYWAFKRTEPLIGKLLKEVFPDIPIENIHKLLEKGEGLAATIDKELGQ